MPAPTRVEAFQQLREFLHHDVKNVLKMEHGGNYTAALVIAVGAEALSRLQDEATDHVLIVMFARYEFDGAMAEDIVKALRHSLAHIFETTCIRVRKTDIELVVGWGERPHMTLRPEPPGLYLNVRTMWEDLQAELGAMQARLEADKPWGQQTPRDWQKRWVTQASPGAIAGWDRLLGPN